MFLTVMSGVPCCEMRPSDLALPVHYSDRSNRSNKTIYSSDNTTCCVKCDCCAYLDDIRKGCCSSSNDIFCSCDTSQTTTITIEEVGSNNTNIQNCCVIRVSSTSSVCCTNTNTSCGADTSVVRRELTTSNTSQC